MKNVLGAHAPVVSLKIETRLGSFSDFARFNTGRADLHATGATLRQLDAYRL
jgi:hypothetical protein